MASDLLGKTSYHKPAFREEAPSFTDCLTCVYYVFKEALGIDIPLTFIGDMPRQLVTSNEWRLLKVGTDSVKCGDLLFVGNKQNEKLISHVAVVVAVDKIFHCSSAFGTAVIESTNEFFASYDQEPSFKAMVRYIDPRNTELRHAHKSSFMAD